MQLHVREFGLHMLHVSITYVTGKKIEFTRILPTKVGAMFPHHARHVRIRAGVGHGRLRCGGRHQVRHGADVGGRLCFS